MATSRRIAVVSALTALAVALPCAAWYVAGSREAERGARRLLEAPHRRARETADQLARLLAERLESLRESESARPWQHYMPEYHQEDGECECPVLKPSPLAAGRVDSLVFVHFQVSGRGEITLPGLAGPTGAWTSEKMRLLEDLRGAIEQLGGPTEPVGARAHGPLPGAGEELLAVGPFRWRTLRLDREPVLSATREVVTDLRRLVQGFAVSIAALESYLGAAAWPATLVEGEAGEGAEAALPLPGVRWLVRIDAGEAVEAASGQAAKVRGRFLRTFLLGALAALVAGTAVVAVAWQSERLSRARARFSAAAAHELRSPLAAMRLYGEMLSDDLGRPEQAREYARRIATEAEQLGRVVGNMLAYSRLERGPLPVHPEPGDLATAVAASLDRLRPAVQGAGARLDRQLGEGLPPVRFDADAVHHIVQNLVDNAERFSRDSTDRTIHVRLDRHGDGVALSVADHGPGVPRERRGTLFRPFDASSAESAAGLGLGLMLVRALAHAHGGDVHCGDTPGGGATFTVVFPA